MVQSNRHKGYFRGWNGLTSERGRKFIKPSQACKQGHMDQRLAYIRSTKSSLAKEASPELDHMVEHEQAPENNKTNMVFMTMVKVEGQLFTDQTGRFPVTSNRGNNYIVMFYAVDPNYIKSYPIKSRHRSELLKSLRRSLPFPSNPWLPTPTSQTGQRDLHRRRGLHCRKQFSIPVHPTRHPPYQHS